MRLGIDDQNDGKSQPLRHLGRTARSELPSKPSNSPITPSTIDRSFPPDRATEQPLIGVPAEHPAIEIVRRNAGSNFVKPGIDKIGADLERLYGDSAVSKGAQAGPA